MFPSEQAPATGDLVCQVVPSGPTYRTENNLRLFLSLIYGATEKVILTSPYFVPDEAMVYAITSACERGLDVQLFVSEVADQWLVGHAQRSYYGVLLDAGVRIFLYPAPYILHSKHFSIDDDIAVIGSSNMDIRSFSLNAEVSVMVRGESFVAGMRQVEEGYRQAGRELTREEWSRQSAQGHVLRRYRQAHLRPQLTFSNACGPPPTLEACPHSTPTPMRRSGCRSPGRWGCGAVGIARARSGCC